MTEEIKFLQQKKPNQTDSFFYDGDIAEATNSVGTEFLLIASGEVRVTIKKNDVQNDERFEYIERYNITDQNMDRLVKDWEMNNWFEVLEKPKGEKEFSGEMGRVEYDFDSAVNMLKDAMEEDAENRAVVPIT